MNVLRPEHSSDPTSPINTEFYDALADVPVESESPSKIINSVNKAISGTSTQQLTALKPLKMSSADYLDPVSCNSH